METITITVVQGEVYDEVAKATDYTGSKLPDDDGQARERILAADDDLAELGRFWDEAVTGANESLKEMLISGGTRFIQAGNGKEERVKAYQGELEVSKSFDKTLSGSVESAIRSYFILSIIGQWFKFANKEEAADYFTQAGDFMTAAERLLYSRRKPTRPV